MAMVTNTCNGSFIWFQEKCQSQLNGSTVILLISNTSAEISNISKGGVIGYVDSECDTANSSANAMLYGSKHFQRKKPYYTLLY